MKVNGIEIKGRSVSGYATAIALPEYNIVFDCGMAVHDAVQAEHVCITHGHLDHFSGIARHAYIRGMTGMAKSHFIVPAWLEGRVHQTMDFWAEVQESRKAPYKVTVCQEGGGPIWVGRNRIIRSFKTDHRIRSQGYILVEERKRLKPEFVGTSGKELGRMRRERIQFEETFEVPLVAFTGDSRIEGFDWLQTRAKVLIAECTFLGDVTVGEARKKGHTHITELASKAAQFKDAEALVLCHFSKRYSNKDIEKAIASLPASLRDKTTYLPVGK